MLIRTQQQARNVVISGRTANGPQKRQIESIDGATRYKLIRWRFLSNCNRRAQKSDVGLKSRSLYGLPGETHYGSVALSAYT